MFKKGDRVTHPKRQQWGIGEILEDELDNAVRVFFVDEGEKKLGLQYVDLQLVEGKEADNEFLDNLILEPKQSGIRERSFGQIVEHFLKIFPLGFDDPNYFDHERDYKTKAHHLMVEILSESEFKSLIDADKWDEACKRILKVVNATNLVFPNEKMSLKDGLSSDDHKKRFAIDVFNLLYDLGDENNNLAKLINTLEEIGAAKWTVLTYFLFIRYPEKHIFLKPMITQSAASIMRFELNYSSQLNLKTYHSLLKLAGALKSRLIEVGLTPKDMIDVQSFIWSVDPSTYGTPT